MSEEKFAQVNIVAGCIIKQNSKYLLVQEKKTVAHGLWNLPAGHVWIGEPIEEAAIREVKEETGYNVKLIREVGVLHKNGDKTVKHVFEARIIDGELKYSKKELLDARWLTLEEIKEIKDKLRSWWIPEAINILEGKKLL